MKKSPTQTQKKAQGNKPLKMAASQQSRKKKFSVLKVKFGPEPSGDTNGEDSNESPPPSSPIKSPQTPDIYTTNEAIPMTIFYRSQHSHGHGGKQRPTLQQLRKGLENDKVWTNFND